MPSLRFVLPVVLVAAPVLAHAEPAAPVHPPDPTGEADQAAQPSPTTAQPQAAEPTPGTAQARAAFVQGTDLAKQERWQDALDAFERSARLRPHPVTTYNIAYCERALGHPTRAWRLFSQALDHGLPPDLEHSAKAYRDEAQGQLARASISIPVGATLMLDGKSLEAIGDGAFAVSDEPDSKARLPSSFQLVADPGLHRFSLSKHGALKTVTERRLDSGDNGALSLELAEPPPPVTEVQPQKALPLPPVVDRAPETTTHRQWVWPITAFGVGAAGTTVGTIFGVRALEAGASLQSSCPTKQCPSGDSGRVNTAQRDALISDIGFGVGAVGVGTGVVLLLVSPGQTEHASVEPWIGVGSLGARGTF